MIKKEREQVLARHLRRKGESIREIATHLKVSKGSVSLWVRDVKLTGPQRRFLAHKPFLREVITKRVITRVRNEQERRRLIIESHKKDIEKIQISLNGLLIVGTCLYWAEGGKADSNRIFRFSNSDPEMIRVMMAFIRNVCRIPENKIKGHIHLHPHLNKRVALKYWSGVSDIPISQFHKTSSPKNRSSKNTRDTLPYGTFDIGIYSTDLYLKMLGRIEVVRDKILKEHSI